MLTLRSPHLVQLSRTALCAASARGLAYSVFRGETKTPTNPIHPRQAIERTWTLSAGKHRFAALEKLKISTPGVTIVRVAPELAEKHVVAEIKVSSNARELLECVEVDGRSSSHHNCTEVDFLPDRSAITSSVYGNLLTEISVPHAAALRQVAVKGCGDVVVGDKVLASGMDKLSASKSVKLAAVMSSRLFVIAPSTHLYTRKLACAVAGNASLYLSLPSVTTTAGDLDLAIAGNGLVFADIDELIAHEISMGLLGSGHVCLRTKSRLRVPEMNAGIVGNGTITVDAPTQDSVGCNEQSISIIGSGSVDFAALPTRDARVFSIGTNDATLRVRDYLRARALGRSTVRCVGGLPDHISAKGFSKPWIRTMFPDEWRQLHDDNGIKEIPKDIPTPEAAFAEDYVLRMPYGHSWCSYMDSMRQILHMRSSRRYRRYEDREGSRGDEREEDRYNESRWAPWGRHGSCKKDRHDYRRRDRYDDRFEDRYEDRYEGRRSRYEDDRFDRRSPEDVSGKTDAKNPADVKSSKDTCNATDAKSTKETTEN